MAIDSDFVLKVMRRNGVRRREGLETGVVDEDEATLYSCTRLWHSVC